jgi:hypothetical protein
MNDVTPGQVKHGTKYGEGTGVQRAPGTVPGVRAANAGADPALAQMGKLAQEA